jgi:hypothetical protein
MRKDNSKNGDLIGGYTVEPTWILGVWIWWVAPSKQQFDGENGDSITSGLFGHPISDKPIKNQRVDANSWWEFHHQHSGLLRSFEPSSRWPPVLLWWHPQDYHEQNYYDVLLPKSVDVIYDCVGQTGTGDHAFNIIKSHGSFVTSGPQRPCLF